MSTTTDIGQVQWSHPRDVTIKFPSNALEQQTLIKFRVEQSGKVGFLKIINEYFYFCTSRNAVISVVDEVTDSESKEPCAFTILIEGSREVVAQQLQKIGSDLLKHSTIVRR